MDQNTPRDEGAQPPAEPGNADASAWNQPPAPDPSQPAAGGGDAATEYAAWSADASYQQQQAAAPAQPSDTQAYAAPQPQSATYSDQPAAAQQQAYDQAAYAQQQQQYQQQQYQQQQQGYDPNAYPQQQGYDPNAYGQQQQPQQQQPQYYDPNAYGQQQQQQGYYDQNAYQQQYAQQGYQQQQAQPYAYAQPGQDAWAQAEPGGYNRSFIAVLSGWVLLTWGFVWGITGALVVYFQGITEWLPEVTLSGDVDQLIADVEATESSIFALGGILLIAGLIHLIAAVGIFGHRRWGRAFGVVLGLLGVLGALGLFTISAGFEAMNVGLDEAIKGEEGSIAASIFVLACYGLVLVGMVVGRRHFKRKGVEG